MAKSLSIHLALADVAKQYRQNFIMLIIAGAIASVGILIDYNTHKHLEEVAALKDAAKSQPTAQGAWDAVKVYAKALGEKHSPLKGNYMGLLVLLLLTYLHLGFVRVCFQSATKGTISLQNFISTPSDYLIFMGATLTLIAMTIGFALAIMGGLTLLHWFALPESVLFFIATLLAMIFMVYMVHFAFIQICLVDKSQGVLEILGASKAIVAGNLGHIVGFFIVMAFFIAIFNLLAVFLVNKIALFVPVQGFSHFVASALTAPLMLLGMISVYKQLK